MRTKGHLFILRTLTAIACAIGSSTCHAQTATPAETKSIAEEAFIYGFPMVMNYGTMYEYFVDKSAPQYKCPFNTLYNTARVYTPADTAVVTPNSDTPYSFVGMDLRRADCDLRAANRAGSLLLGAACGHVHV